MTKIRKMIVKVDLPEIVSFMKLIKIQSKPTIVRWCNAYARQHGLPIYESDYPGSEHLKIALNVINEWLDGTIRLVEVKKIVKEA